MLKIDSITKGVVIDHIEVGKGMYIYNYLNLDNINSSIAIIKNAKSKKKGKKDIIKIEDNIDIDLEILGYIDPEITVNIVDNGQIIEKKRLSNPKKLTDIIKCKNPRCITSTELGIPHIFNLTDEKKHIYRCVYCEQEASK